MVFSSVEIFIEPKNAFTKYLFHAREFCISFMDSPPKKIFQSQNASLCILLLVSPSTYSDSRTYGEPKKDIWRQIKDRHPISNIYTHTLKCFSICPCEALHKSAKCHRVAFCVWEAIPFSHVC